MNILRKILWALNALIPYKKQTFTYFIPAPPVRKSGYREKTFDTIVSELSQKGFRILDSTTQSIGNEKMQGMWVLLTVAPFTYEASKIKPAEFPQEFENNNHLEVINQNIDSNNNEKTIELPKDDVSEIDSEGIYYFD